MGVDTRGGILTKPAAVAVSTLVAIGAVLTLGWKAKEAFEAQAAPQPAIVQRLDAMDKRQQEMQLDVREIRTKVEMLEKRGR